MMLINIIVIAGFIGSAALIYFMISLFLDFLLPYKKPKRSKFSKEEMNRKVSAIKLPDKNKLIQRKSNESKRLISIKYLHF